MSEVVSIEAVVESWRRPADYPWHFKPAERARMIRLCSKASDEEIGSVMVVACAYNNIAPAATADAVLKAFLCVR